MSKQLLVTAALPYVNGHIHIGHLVEYIQADIWVRFQRMQGNRVAYICADDTHGTATMIRARQEGRPESAIIAEMAAAHQADFAGFGVRFDHYGSTNSASNLGFVTQIWKALRDGNHVAEREVTQLFDPQAGCFLADRFVKGTCPKCGAPDQYGDSCDKCASTFSPTDLKDAVSTLTGAKPELRSAKHYFVTLENFHAFLNEWVETPGKLQPEIANWLKGTFLGDTLRDWDVSRPAPYFGFEIPDAPGNYFYVWVDAPVGYIASTKDWCDGNGTNWRSWWPMVGDAGYTDPNVEIHHFIGKDITYFHTLFWPAMLKATGFKLPTQVHVHGFLTVDGEKMSKSKGTFVRARTYLDHLDPQHLRYYYASKLTDRVEDIDLNLTEFAAKVNSDIVGKVVNLASRTAKFVTHLRQEFYQPQRQRYLSEGPCSEDARRGITDDLIDGHIFSERGPRGDDLFIHGARRAPEIAKAYESGNFGSAMRQIMSLADLANNYVEAKAPWALKKDPEKYDELLEVCTVSLNLFRQLCVYLAPVLPELADKAGALLNAPITTWADAQTPVVGKPIAPFSHLSQRVDPEKIKAMITASAVPEAGVAVTPTSPTTNHQPPTTNAAIADDGAALAAEPLAPIITFEDFAKVDLRVARIISAEEVPKAKKILKLTVSLGGEDRRTIFAGIKSAYGDPTKLPGRLIVVVANLAPRQMSFGMSEGMAVAAGPGGSDIFLLSPDSGAVPGQRVH